MPHREIIQNIAVALEKCFKFSSFVVFALLLVSANKTFAQTIKEKIAQLSLEQKIGQLLIWTFSGYELDQSQKIRLKKYQPGGIVVFSRNIKTIKQTSRLNHDAQKILSHASGMPALIMVDQEGGAVTRVKVSTPIPSALALSRMVDDDFIKNYADTSGQLLAALGFNMNLAPVMDLANPSEDSFIGNRTFGNDPREVSRKTLAFSLGLAAAGIIPTAKHFPGHGGAVSDSHSGLAMKDSSLEELQKNDWLPFKNFAEQKFKKAIMTAHVAVPKIDPSELPATFSDKVIKDFLRNQLGFTGLIITDDLEMTGASNEKDIGERAVKAFLAGNDMLMVAGTFGNQRIAYEALLKATKSGRISIARLEESLSRIIEVKIGTEFLPKAPKPNETLIIKKKVEALSKEVMKKNFGLNFDPDTKELDPAVLKKPVLIASADSRFFSNFKAVYKGKSNFVKLGPSSLKTLKSKLEQHSGLILFYASGSKTARWLNDQSLTLKSKVFVINCNHPGEVPSQSDFLNVINMNSHSPESGEWLAEILNQKDQEDLRLPATTTSEQSH